MTAGKPVLAGFLHFRATGQIVPIGIEPRELGERGPSLAVREGVATVPNPERLASLAIQSFAANTSWVRRRMRIGFLAAAPVDGQELPYCGGELTLRYLSAGPGTRPKAQRTGDVLEVTLPPVEGLVARHTAIKRVISAWYRAEATRLLPPAVDRLAQETGLRPSRVLIRTQYSQLGSCATDGTIRLSWRLAMLPPESAEFVIIHELVHLEHRNHGPGFWGAFDALAPGARARTKQLVELARSLPVFR